MTDINERLPASSLRPAATALLIIDVITDFDFDEGSELFKNALPMARKLAELLPAARKAGIPVIYVNDNRGKWQEDLDAQARAIEARSVKGKKILDLVRPTKKDYYVLKPQRSGFYATPLSVLLFSLNVSNLVITGLTTDICVLFTAHDAYMRGFKVKVPEDCSAAVKKAYHSDAVRFVKRVAKADVRPSTEIDFSAQPHAAA